MWNGRARRCHHAHRQAGDRVGHKSLQVIALACITVRLARMHAVPIETVAWASGACAVVLCAAGLTALALGPINGMIAVIVISVLTAACAVLLAIEHRIAGPDTSRFALARATVQQWSLPKLRGPIA